MDRKTEHLNLIQDFQRWLTQQEYSSNTILSYTRFAKLFLHWLDGREVNRELILTWKAWLATQYAASSVNAVIAAINCFLTWQEKEEYKMKSLRIQPASFVQEERELQQKDYIQLVVAAWQEDVQLALLLQTLATTGIRISELEFITVEAVKRGQAFVVNKGKYRTILLSDDLCRLLQQEIVQRELLTGPIFQTKNGQPIDRSNIWRKMKKISQRAGITESKVYPHSFRHLFARTYYDMEKDLARLADLLGHSNVNTTRIYTRESSENCVQILNQLPLIVNQQP